MFSMNTYKHSLEKHAVNLLTSEGGIKRGREVKENFCLMF